jgi:hypothetical protein
MKTTKDKKKLEARLREIEKKEEKLAEKKREQKLAKKKVTYDKKLAGKFFEVRNLWKISDHEIEFRNHDKEDKVNLYVEFLPGLKDEWRATVKLYLFSRKTFCIRQCQVYDLPSIEKEIKERVKFPYPSSEELEKMLDENRKVKPTTDHEFVQWLFQKQNMDKYKESFIVREVEPRIIAKKLAILTKGFPKE